MNITANYGFFHISLGIKNCIFASMKNSYLIGTDIGGTTFSTALFDAHLKLISTSAKGHIRDFNTQKELLDGIALQIEQLIKDRQVIGAGFACPGPLDAQSGRILETPNLTVLQNCQVQQEMEHRLNLPCKIENDANLFALGEHQSYSGKKDVFVGITLGTGLGFGVVINNQLFTGANGLAGEYGISPVQWGMWETAISISGVKKIGKYMLGSDLEPIDLSKLADEDDQKAKLVWEQFGANLGKCMSHVINILDPHAVSLGGGLSHAFTHFKPTLEQELSQYTPAFNHYGIDIFESIDKELSAKRGAAHLIAIGL
jgi:glucokinase